MPFFGSHRRDLSVGDGEAPASPGADESSDSLLSWSSSSDSDEEATPRTCRLRAAVGAGLGIALVSLAALAALVLPGHARPAVAASHHLRSAASAFELSDMLNVLEVPPVLRPKRVLFLGNSLTYVNDLPGQLQHLARANGHELEVANSTIGGCTLYAVHNTPRSQQLLAEDWDLIVIQDHSTLPLFPAAREAYFYPAIQAVLNQRRKAKVAMYMTFPYKFGIGYACPPEPLSYACWPLGKLRNFMQPDCASPSFVNNFTSFACQGYGLLRAYLSTLKRLPELELAVPAGLAWLLLRGQGLETRPAPAAVPPHCRAAVDAQYAEPLDLETRPTADGEAVRWLRLHANVSNHVDLHPTRAGQYLNALTFYRMLFGVSAVGSPQPYCGAQCFFNDWYLGPPGYQTPALPEDQLLALQHAADAAVEQCGNACWR